MNGAGRARVVRESSGGVAWEIATRTPPVLLRPYIRDYCGYVEQSAPGLVRRTEFPGVQVVVIFEFGPPIAVLDNRADHRPSRHRDGFVAGLDDRYTFVEHHGFQHGLQLNLTPLGARLFFDLPMSEIAARVIPVRDLLPKEHHTLTDRLASLPDWDSRFDLIDRVVESRLANARTTPHVAVVWACERIALTGGELEMRGLCQDLGYSPTHLIALFRDQIGFPPKLIARLTRFERLIRHLKTAPLTNWATLAVEFGYYDQAHLFRDMRQFAGMTPTQARTATLETPGSATLEELRAAQQDPATAAAVAAVGSLR